MLSTLPVTALPDGRLDTENAARYLGLSPKTLAQWRSAKIGPRYVKKGRVFYFKHHLDAWLLEDQESLEAKR